jgi:hypothetical protein
VLRILDVLLTLVHLGLIAFNLFGWIPRSTRRLHFISICITAFFWLIPGIWFGIGYCPITDWQWDVKRRLGEKDLPSSFITYFLNTTTNKEFSDKTVGLITAICFALVAGIALYFRLAGRIKKPN